jgi:hypothetical protein
MSLPPRPNSQRKKLIFRVQHIPLTFSEDDLKSALQSNFEDGEGVLIQTVATLVPSCYPQRNTQDALVEFKPAVPAFLQKRAEEKTIDVERQIQIDSGVLSIDSQFLGLTQVSGPFDEKEINMEYVRNTRKDFTRSVLIDSQRGVHYWRWWQCIRLLDGQKDGPDVAARLSQI